MEGSIVKNIYVRDIDICALILYNRGEMNTKAIGIRLETSTIEMVKKKAIRRGWSVNRWISWAVKQNLRSHSKGGSTT